MVKALLPETTRRWVRSQQRRLKLRVQGRGPKRSPRVGWVRFGSLRRLQPIDGSFGMKYGQPIDRYYMERFLARFAADVRGHVLEIGDDTYSRRFGGEMVTHSDVLHVTQGHPRTTIVADLTCGKRISSETFDCIILTQTLQFIYDVRAALRTLERILKPGGVVLATFHGISQIARYDMERWGEYWRFTTLSARKLFTEVFPEDCVTVQAYGNVLTAIAFLHGLVSEELRPEELDHHDRDYEVLITARAMKPKEKVEQRAQWRGEPDRLASM